MRLRVALLLAVLALPASASAGTVFLIDGRGWGHGVGMSQWGAEGYARHGASYRQILAHYYAGTRLEAWNPRPVRVLLGQNFDLVRIGSTAPFGTRVDAHCTSRRGRSSSTAGSGSGTSTSGRRSASRRVHSRSRSTSSPTGATSSSRSSPAV